MTKYRLLTIGCSCLLATTVTAQTLALKNNLLYDITLTPNLGIELRADSLSTVQLFYGLHPWRLSDTKRLRHWSLMPEYRRWFKEPFLGHFVGVHALGGEFNIAGIGPTATMRNHHYQGWYVGGGLTYGYAWRLSEAWRLETAIGLGFVHTARDKYQNETCGLLLDAGRRNYVGPTKLAVNLAYLVGKKKKKPVEVSQPVPTAVAVVPPEPEPKPQYNLRFIVPQAEAAKARSLSGRAYLDFPVNRIDILPDYRNNRDELAKVLQTLDAVRQDPNTSVTHVNIHGYASPEGRYDHNALLADSRAQAFKAYVQSLLLLDDTLFSVQSTPEDWEGLIEKMESVETTAGAATIITSSLTPDEKERQLRTKHPAVWQQLLTNVFPALRHSDYEVRYTIRPFTVEEAREILKTKPQQLSLNELFLVAQTYEPGSQAFNDVFETAVRLFPDDPTANLNAAVIALRRGDTTEATRRLQKAGNTPEAQLARQVLDDMNKRNNIHH